MPEGVSSSTRRSGSSRSRNSRTAKESKLAGTEDLPLEYSNAYENQHEPSRIQQEYISSSELVNGHLQGQVFESNDTQRFIDPYQAQNVMFYPGINDMADALEALPMEIIRHFTLLREIDAKCVTTTPELTRLIKEFLNMPLPARELEAAAERAGGPNKISMEVQSKIAELASERERVLFRIRILIRELMPCLEEKMHVAGVAADAISRHVARLDYDFDELIVKNNEIPHEIRYGPETHPAYLPIVTATEQKQSTRSEARREAMAARKAAQAAQAQQAAAAAAATLVAHSGSGSGRNTPRGDDKSSRNAKSSVGNGRGSSTSKSRKGTNAVNSSNSANASNSGRSTNNSYSTNHGAELANSKGNGNNSTSSANGKAGSRFSNRDSNEDATPGRKRSNSGMDPAAVYTSGLSRNNSTSANSSTKRKRSANGDDIDANTSLQVDKKTNNGKADRSHRRDGEGDYMKEGDIDDDESKLFKKSGGSGSGGNSKKKGSSGSSSSANNNGSSSNNNSAKKKKNGGSFQSSGSNSRSSKNPKKSQKQHNEDDDLDDDGDNDMDDDDLNDEDDTRRKRNLDTKNSGKGSNSGSKASAAGRTESGNTSNGNDAEQVYCYCQQVSYGEMVACDGPFCAKEWFHLPCIGMSSPPEGKWFCRDCKKEIARQKRNQGTNYGNGNHNNQYPNENSDERKADYKASSNSINQSNKAQYGSKVEIDSNGNHSSANVS